MTSPEYPADTNDFFADKNKRALVFLTEQIEAAKNTTDNDVAAFVHQLTNQDLIASFGSLKQAEQQMVVHLLRQPRDTYQQLWRIVSDPGRRSRPIAELSDELDYIQQFIRVLQFISGYENLQSSNAV